MGFRTALVILAILAMSVLAVAVLILRPQLLVYMFIVFAPCVAIFFMEGGSRRFAWIGSAALTVSAAGPIIFGALLDTTRFVMGDTWAWVVPVGAGMLGTAIAVVLPVVGEMMTAREQKGQFEALEERQQALIAEWGEEQLREPLNPPG
ncbi:MAG: hypothetical protein ING19_09775 [Azospirillum sp.]|nr:hypothetical protein [Azospirillum sp.]